MESKEKNDKYENDKKKRETPLEQTLKVKEKELSGFISVNKKYKKQKEELQKELDEKVNMDQINDLTSQINLAKEKKKNY
jgi:hypothetical protein